MLISNIDLTTAPLRLFMGVVWKYVFHMSAFSEVIKYSILGILVNKPHKFLL
jgi:hypothetical protein